MADKRLETDNVDVTKHSFYLDDEDKRALETLKDWYGLTTDSEVVRLVLRVAIASGKLEFPNPLPPSFQPPETPPTGRRSRRVRRPEESG